MSQNEFDAQVDLAFNVGEGTLSVETSPGLNQAIADEDYDDMSDNLMYSRDQNGEQLGGLETRSNNRRDLFLRED